MEKDFDVLGLKIEDAKKILPAKEVNIELKITKPPITKELSDNLRVIKQKMISNEKVELVLAAEVLRKEVPEDEF